MLQKEIVYDKVKELYALSGTDVIAADVKDALTGIVRRRTVSNHLTSLFEDGRLDRERIFIYDVGITFVYTTVNDSNKERTMQYNIDTFIRQLQSNIAKRKEKISVFEWNVMHCKNTYHRVKQDIHSYLTKVEEVDPVVLERYEENVTEWRTTVKKHKTALLKLVEQQKTDRKMLAYFINEKRYTTTKER